MRGAEGGKVARHGCMLALVVISLSGAWKADAASPPLRGLWVVTQQPAAARNPLLATEDNLEQGQAIYYGKGFCVTCHGRNGKGLNHIVGLRGALPRDFTDQNWQRRRRDGDLMQILREGSEGTAMAPFVPLVLSEHEAWQVILFIRTFGQ